MRVLYNTGMNTERGRVIHGKAEHEREAGNFLEALKLTDEAMIMYQEDDDLFGLCDVLSSRFLTLRHLYEKTNSDVYLIIAKKTVEAAYEIAQKKALTDGSFTPAFRLAQAHHTLNELPEAINLYLQAINLFENHPPKEHNRPAVLADMKGQLAIAEYKNGDEAALDRAMEALSDLMNSDEPQYNKDVWVSGAHMKIAEAVATKDPESARVHLNKAHEIISANPELVLRKGQLAKLRQKLSL